MPELPEVETVKNGLIKLLGEGVYVRAVKVVRRDLRFPVNSELEKEITGKRIDGLRRRAKYLLWDLENVVLVSHLGMTGTWRVAPKGEEKKHDHVYITLSDGRRLAYRDPRRFGFLEFYYKKDEASFGRFLRLGPEPLSRNFKGAYLERVFMGRSAPVKNVIMDQKVVVGVGNIYACEALFNCSILPDRPAQLVSKEEASDLVREIKSVLKQAIKSGGSTINDFKKAGGESGYFQHRFKVYGREGQLCESCKEPIRKIQLGGRGTFFCTNCQK